MAGVILRTAGGTLLFAIFLWLVRIDDYRVAGMMLTFPMLNGIGLVAAGENAERLTKSMVPVITLNGAMCFLFASALVSWETARAYPGTLTALATALWVGVYAVLQARDVTFARSSSMLAYAAGCALASLAATYWLWPACMAISGGTAVRPGGLAGVVEGWPTIVLFAASLAIAFGVAHSYQHAHAAIGRLAALPMVPLFGLYTVATVAAADPEGLAKLEVMRSLVLIGWIIALVFVVALSHYVASTAFAPWGGFKRITALFVGWALCLGCIVASAKVAAAVSACTSG